jgi:hypothetical protein
MSFNASSIVASTKLSALLEKLHALSSAQENSYGQSFFYLSRLARYIIFGESWTAGSDDHMRDKFVALEADKCQFVYLLARSMGALNIVEAGTSFGVSTMYLALAVGQNVAQANAKGGVAATGKVIGTEKEPTKAAKAKEYWKEAGEEVEPWIELREGDLLETLKVEEGMPEQIDMLLLDSRLPLRSPRSSYTVFYNFTNTCKQYGRHWPSQPSKSFNRD